MTTNQPRANLLVGASAALFVTAALGLLGWTLWVPHPPSPIVVKAPPQSAPTPAPTPRPTPRPLTDAEQATQALGFMEVPVTSDAFVAAVREGQLERAKLLLRAGIEPTAPDQTGTLPLTAAAERETTDMLTFLSEHGATPDRTTLLAALHASRLEPVAWLLDRGIEATDPDLLALALQTNDPGIIARFLAPLPPAQPWSPMMRTALFAAIQRGDEATLKLLLEKHPDPPTLEPGAQPLLAYMVAWNDLDHARMLLAAGADPNVRLSIPAEEAFLRLIPGKRLPHYLREEQGLTPLMLAAGMDRTDMLRLLLEHGANRNLRTGKYKIAALTFAAWASAVQPMQILLGVTPGTEVHHVRISLSRQRAVLYKNGEATLSAGVSTGQKSHPTPTGEFVVTDKNISRMSSIYKVKMPYFMRLNCSEVGLHAGVIPGYPASHGCIRFPKSKAQELYRQLQLGDRVSILP